MSKKTKPKIDAMKLCYEIMDCSKRVKRIYNQLNKTKKSSKKLELKEKLKQEKEIFLSIKNQALVFIDEKRKLKK